MSWLFGSWTASGATPVTCLESWTESNPGDPLSFFAGGDNDHRLHGKGDTHDHASFRPARIRPIDRTHIAGLAAEAPHSRKGGRLGTTPESEKVRRAGQYRTAGLMPPEIGKLLG